MNIGERLKKIRLDHNYSQQNIADAINLNIGTYQHYERNRAIPSIYKLIALSNFYGFYSIDILIGLVEEPMPGMDKFTKAYYQAKPDKRKIIDYILSLKE